MTDSPDNDRDHPGPLRRPRRKGDLWVRREGDQTAVYDPETARLHMLNASALAIWEACDGETSVKEIIDAVIELTNLEAGPASAEVTRALEDLDEAGLVV